MMNTRQQQIGRLGENIAAQYLSEKGYTILARNFRTPYGEIDMICHREHLLIFIEVKARTSRTFGYPEDSINSSKQAHMRASAEYYIGEHPECSNDCEFDVISVEITQNGKEQRIMHFENVIT